MGDTTATRPDYQCLFAEASSQHGLFTAAQARACGFRWERLSSGAKSGRFIRIRRGLYRLRDYPRHPREDVVEAWLALGKETAVVSHESALDLLELSDVIPNATHLTVPRSKRHHPDIPGLKIHTTSRPFAELDRVERDGILLTSATRTILDAAEAGTAPDQIEMAIQQALDRGMTTAHMLLEGARERSRRVQRLVSGALK